MLSIFGSLRLFLVDLILFPRASSTHNLPPIAPPQDFRWTTVFQFVSMLLKEIAWSSRSETAGLSIARSNELRGTQDGFPGRPDGYIVAVCGVCGDARMETDRLQDI
jgi:hypothetical protein